MTLRLLPVLLLLASCAEAPTLSGQVVDIWGNPVKDATVVVDGQSWRPSTDSDGYFTLPFTTGELKIKAGRQGYIQSHHEITVDDQATAPRPVLKLYPKPETNGFYVIGTQGYQRIEPAPVYSLGNDLRSITGLKNKGEALAEGPLRVVFHTDLSQDEIARFGLELHKVSFHKTEKLSGPLGKADVPVNLYVSEGVVEIDIQPLRSPNDYLLTANDIAPGTYAFHTMGLLAPRDSESFSKIPESLRVAFPVEVR